MPSCIDTENYSRFIIYYLYIHMCIIVDTRAYTVDRAEFPSRGKSAKNDRVLVLRQYRGVRYEVCVKQIIRKQKR